MLKLVGSRFRPDRRLWYRGDGFDLFVWPGPGRTVRSFQLCREDATGMEYCVAGDTAGAMGVFQVDTGESEPRYNRTPLMCDCRGLRPPGDGLQAAIAGLDPALRDQLLARLTPLSSAGDETTLTVLTDPGTKRNTK